MKTISWFIYLQYSLSFTRFLQMESVDYAGEIKKHFIDLYFFFKENFYKINTNGFIII